ncbi:LAQU0S09e01376g1_1 [Lachancea quebecensis]|uniref:Topoisomerase I damage affected protein 2 n=1 Tax=Lachancea quebecensis TaxID=1654605 RepID=A0A0P1KVM6_9SACH|nr:LAQU0S09e01376g1_1 [Lachancea quebecensis]
MPALEVNSVPSSAEFPAAPEKLASIIEASVKDAASDDLGACTESILVELNKASSAHKFVVSLTKVAFPDSEDFDLSIDSNIGGSWNKVKDGAYSYSVETETGARILATVVWISK